MNTPESADSGLDCAKRFRLSFRNPKIVDLLDRLSPHLRSHVVEKALDEWLSDRKSKAFVNFLLVRSGQTVKETGGTTRMPASDMEQSSLQEAPGQADDSFKSQIRGGFR